MIKSNKFLIWGYIIFSIFCLLLALVIAIVLNMWSLVYPVLLIYGFMQLALLLKLWINDYLRHAATEASRRKLFQHAIVLYLINSLLIVSPLIVLLISSLWVTDIFNIYMFLSFFISSLLVISGSSFYSYKKELAISEKTTSKEVCQCKNEPH